MKEEEDNFIEKLPKYIFNVLVVSIAVMAALVVTQDREHGSSHPFAIRTANAEMIAAAPGFLTLSVPQAGGNFYVVDSTKQVICVYQLDGDRIRLVSARDFSIDTEIKDSSLPLPGPNRRPIKIEGGSGVDTDTAAFYAKQLKQYIENLSKAKRR